MCQIPELEQIMDLREGKPVTLEYLKDISASVGGNIFSLTGLSSTPALTSSPWLMLCLFVCNHIAFGRIAAMA